MKEFDIQKFLKKYLIPIILFLCSIRITSYMAVYFNPDSDSLFLIENGRWILENKAVPKINPWNVNDNLGIIVQQWLCSIINYVSYKAFGLEYLWVTAMIMNIILLCAVCYFLKAFSKSIPSIIVALSIFEVLIYGYVSTRPYQITMSISFVMLGMLIRRTTESYSITSKDSFLHNGKTALLCGLLALLQANYQLAFFPMLFAWPLCFVAPKFDELKPFIDKVIFGNKENNHSFGKIMKGVFSRIPWLLMIYISMFLFGLLNPYGLSGLLYLPKSSLAINDMKPYIFELQAQKINSVFGNSLILVAIILFIAIREKLFTPELMYLALGGVFLAYGTSRNTWIVFPAAFALLVKYFSLKDSYTMKVVRFLSLDSSKATLRRVLPVFIIFVIIIPNFIHGMTVDKRVNRFINEDAVAYLDTLNKDDIKLYTTFNTGAQLEFFGYKVFMDPRPELYSPPITKADDQFKEWFVMSYKDPEKLLPYIMENNFTHALLNSSSYVDAVLKHNENFVEVARDENSVLYERKDFKETEK